MRRALENTAFERALGPVVDVLGGEQLLCAATSWIALVEIALLRTARSRIPRFVEMNVGFDQSRRDQPSAEVDEFPGSL